MKNSSLFFILTMLLMACSPEQQKVDSLGGTWNITSITGDSTLILPDSMPQYFTFFSCGDVYTSTCRFEYRVENTDSTFRADTLRYTLKGDELAVVSGTSTVPFNFTKLLRYRRFTILQLDEQSLVLERFDDKSIKISAIKQ